jgi:predicted GIY-YIG superfamily endonuclease
LANLKIIPNTIFPNTIFPVTLIPLFNTLMVASKATKVSLSLLQTLKQYRSDQAYIRAVPPASVFSNKLLVSINSARPNTLTSLLKLRGIGPVRCQNYGKDIVRMVNLDSNIKRKKSIERLTGIKSCKKPRITVKGTTKNVKCKPYAKKISRKPRKSRANPRKISNGVRNHTDNNKFLGSEQVPALTVSRSMPKSLSSKRLPVSPKSSVYVLELEGGRVYVGSSKDVPKRIAQHTAGYGSAYTRLYRPTGVQLPRLGNIEGDGDAAERDETLRYMMIRGIHLVRGWKFSRVDMPTEEFDEAEANIRELFDLCRRCGYKGHFCTQCRATLDRLGNQVKR